MAGGLQEPNQAARGTAVQDLGLKEQRCLGLSRPGGVKELEPALHVDGGIEDQHW